MNNQNVVPDKKQSKIIVCDEALDQALRTLQELKKRGATVRLDDLFSDVLLKIEPSYWDEQLQKHTPDDYLLELAKQNPETRKYLMKQARRALDAASRGENLNRVRKKRSTNKDVSIVGVDS